MIKFLIKTLVILAIVFFISFSYGEYHNITSSPFNAKSIKIIKPKNIELFDVSSDEFAALELSIESSINSLEKNEYLISIIIPVYNVEKYLEECIDSIVSQTDAKKHEVILIENNSSDNSLEIAKRYAVEYKNVKLIRQDGGGVSGARNTGVLYSEGQYIVFLDSDDWFKDNAIASLEASISSDDAEIIFFDIHSVDDVTGAVKEYRNGFEYNKLFHTSEFQPVELNNRIYNSAWSRLYTRELLLHNELFFVENLYHEDYLLDLITFTKPISFKFSSDIIMNYRVNRVSSITYTAMPHIEHFIVLYDIFQEYLKQEELFDEYKTFLLNREIERLVFASMKKMNAADTFSLLKYLHLRYSDIDYLPNSKRHAKYFKWVSNGNFMKLWVLKLLPKRIEYLALQAFLSL